MRGYDEWKTNPGPEPKVLRITLRVVVDVAIDAREHDPRAVTWEERAAERNTLAALKARGFEVNDVEAMDSELVEE